MEVNEKKLYEELEIYIEENSDNLIMILHRAQEMWGYLPKELLTFIANKMNIPISKIYGVVTFYSFFNMEKRGKYIIDVCMGTACFVKRADQVLDEFKRILDIDINETTKDGKFTLQSVRCIGACGLAPILTVNGKVYGKVTKDMVKDILNDFKE